MSEYIYIHGKFYDLGKLKKSHPGGSIKIFDAIKNEEDCTPIFESSHAMKDIDKIYEMMKMYEIEEKDYSKFSITDEIIKSKQSLKKFNFDNYHRLTKLVKEKLSENHKVEPYWYFKVSTIFLTYVFFYYNGLLNNHIQLFLRIIYCFIAGFFWIYLGFCTMHDASHYGLFNPKYKSLFFNNDLIVSLWNGWGLWNSYIWLKQHSYAHHSFTGIWGKDTDMIHERPIYVKPKSESKIKNFLAKIFHRINVIVFFIMPGMYYGQSITYLIGVIRGFIWNLNVYDAFKKTPLIEKILYVTSLNILLFNSSYLAVLSYVVAININYAICIIPDHDTYESTFQNEKETDDWCEWQIRKSTNFCEDSKLITELGGGINHQIEHHLFPPVSHCHYHKILPIIKSFCIEKEIPHVHMKSLTEVYKSYRKMLKFKGKNMNNIFD